MQQVMELKPFLRITFMLGTIWNFTASFLGIMGIFGVTNFRSISIDTIGACMTATIASLVILSLNLYSEDIWKSKGDAQSNLLRYSHIMAIVCDAYFIFLGTAQNVLLRESRSIFISIGLPEVFGALGFEAIITLLIMTAILTMSPIMLAKVEGWKF